LPHRFPRRHSGFRYHCDINDRGEERTSVPDTICSSTCDSGPSALADHGIDTRAGDGARTLFGDDQLSHRRVERGDRRLHRDLGSRNGFDHSCSQNS
jgi:hypothetical protein